MAVALRARLPSVPDRTRCRRPVANSPRIYPPPSITAAISVTTIGDEKVPRNRTLNGIPRLSISSIVGADIRIAFHDSAARDRCLAESRAGVHLIYLIVLFLKVSRDDRRTKLMGVLNLVTEFGQIDGCPEFVIDGCPEFVACPPLRRH